MSITREQVIEFLSKMSVVELATLLQEMKEAAAFSPTTVYYRGVSDEEFLKIRPVYGAPPPPELGLYLTDIGDNATQVYGKLREVLPLSLQEVKKIRESLPFLITQALGRSDLEALARELNALGASTKIQPA